MGVSTPQIYRMIKAGTLQCTYIETSGKKRPVRVYESAVVAALEYKVTDMDLPGIGGIALRALALAEANEERTRQISELLGLNTPLLSVEEEDVIALHVEAEERAKKTLVPNSDEILRWAKIFYAMNDNYFNVVRQALAQKDPWFTYLRLGEQLFNELQPFIKETHIRNAAVYLEAGRRHLQAAAYMFLRRTSGSARADELFPDVSGGLEEDIIALLVQLS